MEGQSSRGSNISTGSGDPDSTLPRLRTRPDPLLVACRCFSVLTSLAAILCIAVNVLSAVHSFRNLSDIFDGIFRCYAVVIAVFVVIAETEWEFIVKFSKILEYWAGRGMLQIFVAVMTRAYPQYLRNHQELFLLQSISSYLLMACGLVYVISESHTFPAENLLKVQHLHSFENFQGVLCIGMVKRARQKKELSREQAIKDLEDLERRREELESLLITDRA